MPRKTSLNWFMPGVGEQQGGVVRRDQRRAAHDAVAAFGEKVEKALSDFVTCHGESFWNGLKSNCRSWRLKTGGVDGQGSSAIMDLCIGPSKSSRKLRRRSGTQPMSFLDNLENNLKALENQEEKNPEKVKRDRERREAERGSALLRAPHAEALKNSAFTSQLLTQCRTIGREQRVLVQFTWIGENLRLDAAAKRMELTPTPEGIVAVFSLNGAEVSREMVDPQAGDARVLARQWLKG